MDKDTSYSTAGPLKMKHDQASLLSSYMKQEWLITVVNQICMAPEAVTIHARKCLKALLAATGSRRWIQ